MGQGKEKLGPSLANWDRLGLFRWGEQEVLVRTKMIGLEPNMLGWANKARPRAIWVGPKEEGKECWARPSEKG